MYQAQIITAIWSSFYSNKHRVVIRIKFLTSLRVYQYHKSIYHNLKIHSYLKQLRIR